MKTIPLTQGYVTWVDDQDYPALSRHKWCALVTPTGVYAKRSKNAILMHRTIKNPPAGYEVDHRNGDTLNNCRDNLRCVTKSQNARNSRKHRQYGSKPCTSRFKGVSLEHRTGKWVAYINVDGVRRSLGTHVTEKEAAVAYNQAAINLHGEFALVNLV